MQATTQPDESEQSLYERVGGHEAFATMVHTFFERAKADPELSHVYPNDDWQGAEERLLMFMEQYWGGPMTYSLTRGAPMLRMRHMPYRITRRGAESWARCWYEAVDSVDIDPEDAAQLRAYADRASVFMINADD
ncbi:MAG: globin [Propioniciclava sp.]|uniref:globin domain-containing protein n=1 Tax=Propioniciclava sp. TaxID=2038686 RepID=UPI0039E21EA3